MTKKEILKRIKEDPKWVPPFEELNQIIDTMNEMIRDGSIRHESYDARNPIPHFSLAAASKYFSAISSFDESKYDV